MTIEYLIRSNSLNIAQADVLKHDSVIATIQQTQKGDAVLTSNDGGKWKLTQRVDGETRPFSMLVEKVPQFGALAEVVLKIRNHLFSYRRKMYMLSNVPEGRTQHHAMRGPKFISRLVNFPYDDPSKVDPETQNRLRRVRGVPVGKISGLGLTGHRVDLEPELEEIGLPLSAAVFLLYTTHGGTREKHT